MEDPKTEALRNEQLRRRALDGEASGWRLGLAVLQRRGVVAWARAWRGLAPAAAPPPVEAPAGGELVGVLADARQRHALR